MMAFSGVRSSWDMFARNCDLCWLASASWRFASWSSSNSRAFSIASDRLVGERLEQRDLRLGERAGRSLRRIDQRADDSLLAQQRDGEQRAEARPAQSVESRNSARSRSACEVLDLDGAPLAARPDRPRRRRGAGGPLGSREQLGRHPVRGAAGRSAVASS